MTDSTPDFASTVAAALANATSPVQLAMALLPLAERTLLQYCALPLRFNQALVDDELRKASGVTADSVPFSRLTILPGVAQKPGYPGWFLVEPAVRAQAERDWTERSPASILPTATYRQLNRRLVEWFQKQEGDFENEIFFNRLACEYGAAKTALTERFAEAINRFDLATCGALLDVLDVRSGLDPELATFRSDARGLLGARAAFADDYYRTTRYFKRPDLIAAFEELLSARDKFILHLYGAGGRGKTMFLRWIAAHQCLPRAIPIARVDFDFLGEADHGLEPRFFFGMLAEQLSPQIRTAPLNEMLEDVHQMRVEAVARRAKGDHTKSTSATDDEEEIVSRFATIVGEHCHGPVVFVFDTLEEARFRHDVDVKAVVDAVAAMRARIAQRVAGDQAPRLCLVLAGRYSISQQYPEVERQYGSATISIELASFTESESRAYLMDSRGLSASMTLEAIIKNAKGNPFTLSLYADLLQTNDKLEPEDINELVDLDTLYLVERILKRIPDPALRWVIRYGALARRLTRGFLANVLTPHLQRAMRTDSDDDPTRDNVRSPARWRPVWTTGASGIGVIDTDRLWTGLCNYVSLSSWIRLDPAHDDALILAPVVTHPMRRALRPQPIVAKIHQDAIRMFKRQLASRSLNVPDALASLTYHEFQLLGPKAAEPWRARLRKYVNDPGAIRAISQIVLSEDLQETEAPAASGTGALVSSAVKNLARFTLASTAELQSRDEIGERKETLLAEARRWLREYDQFATVNSSDASPPVAKEAILRWTLSVDPVDRAKAIQQLQDAEKATRTSDERAQLLNALEMAFRENDPAQGEKYARGLAQLDRRRRRGSAFALASIRVLDYLVERGAVAEAVKHCDLVNNTVVRLGTRDIPRPWLGRSIRLEAERGFPLSAVARERQLLGTGAQKRSALEVANRALLLLQADQPVDAADLAGRLVNGTASVDISPMVRCSARIIEGTACQRLMLFDTALASFEHAVVEGTELGARSLLVDARLAKALFYLDGIGDLRQALLHVDDRDEALVDVPADWRLPHLLIRMRVHDRLGDVTAADRLFDAALAGLRDLRHRRPQHTVSLALNALRMTHFERRPQALRLLLEGLMRFDDPIARTAALDGIEQCSAVANTPGDVRRGLLDLLDADAAPKDDRLCLQMRIIDAHRLVGSADEASEQLRRLRRDLRKADRPRLNQQAALLCDRLLLDVGTVLPDGWLGRFLEGHKSYSTLCAAAHIEEAAREYRVLSLEGARIHAIEGLRLLRHPQAVRSILDASANALLAMISAEDTQPQEAEEYRRAEAVILDELGITRPTAAEPLREHRNQAWLEELREADQFEVRILSADQVELTSWGTTRPMVGRTPRSVPPSFQEIFSRLDKRPLGGTASLALVQQLAEDWQKFGGALAVACLPPSLLAAIASRLALPPDSGSLGIDVIIESTNASIHAVPWEIATLPGRSAIVCEDRVHHFWRGSGEVLRHTRVNWAQRTISSLFGQRLIADGIEGPTTTRAIENAQYSLGLPRSGVLDVVTRRRLRETVRQKRSREQPDTVLLVQSEEAAQVTAQRGFASTGTDLAGAYRHAGFATRTLTEADPERLREELREGRCRVVHLAAPVAESRSGGDLFLRMGTESPHGRESRVFTASLLSTYLRSAAQRGTSPIVLVDVPRPPSLDEAWRQLVLRNVFAAQLFTLGALHVVLATGLAEFETQQQVSETLALGLKQREVPGDLFRKLRRDDFSGHIDVLGTRCCALFARDPELNPEDVAGHQEG